MMPDLGKYAATVLSAYGVSLTLLGLLLLVTVAKGRAARKALQAVEKRNG